jgi:hypothetical protein
MAAEIQAPTTGIARSRMQVYADRVGPAPYALSAALVVDAVAVTLTSRLARDLIRGPAVSVGNLQGTALVMGVVTVPVLLASMLLAARSPAAIVGWIGALGSIAYQAVLFLFATPFNAFFFLYVALASLAIWSLVALVPTIKLERFAARFGPRTPNRALAAYLVINAALFLMLWLRATVPAVLSSEPPAFLEGTGMLTGPVQVIDLGFTLPLMVFAAALLWQRRPWGFVLAGGLLVMLAIETLSIAVDQWLGHAADPASPAASAEIVPVMLVLTAVGLVALGFYLRAMSGHGAREG